MSLRLEALSSPTAEMTPRNRVARGSALAVAAAEKAFRPRLTGLLRSRRRRRGRAPDLNPHAAGVAPSGWKIELLLCQSVQCGAPKAVLVSDGAALPWLLVGQLSAKNICQE